MHDYNKLWENALSEISLSVSPANFSTWFNDTYILKQEEGVIYLGVPNPFTRDWLYTKFHNTILKILRQMD
jgi:chromosomal replication initiator protein